MHRLCLTPLRGVTPNTLVACRVPRKQYRPYDITLHSALRNRFVTTSASPPAAAAAAGAATLTHRYECRWKLLDVRSPCALTTPGDHHQQQHRRYATVVPQGSPTPTTPIPPPPVPGPESTSTTVDVGGGGTRSSSIASGGGASGSSSSNSSEDDGGDQTSNPSSKVETTVKAILKGEVDKAAVAAAAEQLQTKRLAQELQRQGQSSLQPLTAQQVQQAQQQQQQQQQQIAVPARPLWKRVWDEFVHYYHGFRLLFIDIRVCSRLLYRILRGQDLTRREHKQLVRTTSDLFRLVPFSVFIIVPFMELLLPVAVKLFPGMLPSTFQSAKYEKDKIKTQLKMKLEMAKFLQTTLDEMAVKQKGETHSHAAKEFAMFCEKIREAGNFASSEEILKFSKLFEDELTLDSLDRPQLMALCKLLEISSIGTTQVLRFQLRMRLKSLKNDDIMIKKEGLDALTVQELQQACRARGMRSLGVPEEKLRYQLNQWLDLSLRESISPSMLLLSRAMLLPENVNPTEQLRETITHLPKQAITEAKYKIGEVEGKVDNRTKLEIIKQEEQAIREERREAKRAQMEEEAKESRKKIDDELKDLAEPVVVSRPEEDLVDKAPIVGEAEAEQKLSKEDLDELEDAIETIAAQKNKLLIEKEEIEELKKEVQDYEEDVKELVQVTRGTGELAEAKGAHRLYKKVNSMIKSLDSVIDKLNEEKMELKEMETSSVDEAKAESVRDDIVGINELVLSMRRLQKSTDDSRSQMIQEILDTIDVDHDGKIEIDLVLKVIDAVGRENVKVSPKHMKEIIELMLREEAIRKRDKREKEEAAAKLASEGEGRAPQSS